MENEINNLYYNKIMGNYDLSCKHLFHGKWIDFLDGIALPYSDAIQLRIGSHLRPLLVYWGSGLSSQKSEDLDNEDVTELAICVEILHKVSIIVDDLIDYDLKRHNKVSFHTQYSSEETIIFSVFMLGKAFEKINILSQKYNHLTYSFSGIYAKTLQEMASGCLNELTLTTEQKFNYKNVVSIICKETSTLIRNSLLLGYMTNMPAEVETITMIKNLGDKIGYLFQSMNDLEPFCASNNLIEHKGTLNMDFEHSRKNVVLPYIFGSCSISEKKQLLKYSKINTETILKLYKKYDIEVLIKRDLIDIENEVKMHFDKLYSMQVNNSCLQDFQKFYTDIMNIAKERLHNNSQQPID